MGYEVHIERETPVSAEEWRAAVEATEGTRIAAGGTSAVNPRTGERIVIAGSGLDAEVLLDGEWSPVLRFSARGSVSFRPSPGFESEDDDLRRAVRALAARLSAEVVGDEGESYP